MQHDADHRESGHQESGRQGGMLQEMHRNMLWAHMVNLALGVWLLTSPFILGYADLEPTARDLPRLAAERDLLPVETRSLLMVWSDVLSGLLIIVFSVLSLSPSRRFPWAQWANAVVGAWLLFAPLIFWAPSAAAYANDTLVGVFVIAFAVLVPMMPGMGLAGMMQQAAIPPGWDYNPGMWLQRLPMAALAILGILVARYLSAYQMGHIDGVWDPFFDSSGASPKNGTEDIITSDMSRAWPVPDAGLGATAYWLEMLMAVMGDPRRWRTMPWMVLTFVIIVVPLGAVSIFFIISQPIFIGTYCTLCLIQALAMLVMMPYALDELVAMGQFLKDARRRGLPFWRTFWMGGDMPGCREKARPEFAGDWRCLVLDAVRGVNLPWTLGVCCLIGVWLMFSRLIFGTGGAMADSDHLVGALIITVSVLALAEVARTLRWLNLPLGLWLIAAPWLLADASGAALVNSMIAGALVAALSLPRGPIRYRYAGWDRYIV